MPAAHAQRSPIDKRKGPPMPTHEALFEIPQKCVHAKDIEAEEVRSDEAKLGTLLISAGNIEWVPAKNSVRKFSLAWERFSEVMIAERLVVRIKK